MFLMTIITPPSAAKSNIVNIANKKTGKRPRVKKNTRRQREPSPNIAAAGVLIVGLVLTALSLSHLAQGVQLVTGSDSIGSWSMAIGIDLNFIVLELAMLVAPADMRKPIGRYANPAIIGTLAFRQS
jgi:hypothetical protein